MRNYFLILYCHKELHLWVRDPPVFFFCDKHYQKYLNLTKLTFTYSKSKRRALEQGVKSVQS